MVGLKGHTPHTKEDAAYTGTSTLHIERAKERERERDPGKKPVALGFIDYSYVTGAEESGG